MKYYMECNISHLKQVTKESESDQIESANQKYLKYFFSHNELTCNECTIGTGVTERLTGPMPSKNVYSALSVLIIVHDAPSLTISRFGSRGHGVA